MRTFLILSFIIFFFSIQANAQQVIDKLNVNQLKLPKESSNKALILDGSGQVKSSSTISDTELGYLEGLSDTLVNLLSGKANDADVVKLSGNQSIDGIKTFEGKLVASSTVNGSIPCPVMTEAQRDLFTPVEGDCVYNSDTLKLNVFDGSVWKDVGGAGGISLWLTANPYNVNDIIIESDKIYRCLIAHTSGVFATDLAASKWIEVSSGLQSPVALADGGTGVAITPVAGSIVYVDADSFEQVSGTAGQVLQSNGSGAPTFVNKSISAKSQNNASVTAEEIQVPNNLLTQVDTNKHLNETGNKNILTNPSFEHSTFSSSWVNSAGTFSQETSIVIDGKASAKLVLSSETMSLSQSSTLYQAQFADGVQGLASVRVKSDVALKVCSIQAGVVSTSNCVDVQANNKWGLYKVPMILGATSNGISIASSGAVTGTVYIDDAFVGAVDLKTEIDSSKIAGEAYFAGTTGCNWSRTSTTIGAFTATSACPGPTITYQNMGQWQTTDSDLPKVTINNLPAGTYKATFLFNTYQSVAASNSISIYDGSSLCQSVGANAQISATSAQSFSCVFSYTSSGNRNFEIYGSSASSTINIDNTAPSGGVKNTRFILEYFGSSSVYSSTNADTDWASCGHTPADFTGFGTVSAIETQCKRQGSDLLMRGKFTSGIGTPVEARVNLKLGGLNLTSASSSIIPSIQYAGPLGVNTFAATYFTSAVLIEPSVSYFTIGNQTSTSSQITKNLGSAFASGNILSFNARIPIEGWQNSNIIIGQFNGLESCTNTLDCTDTFSANVTSANVVQAENVDWISGNGSSGGTGITTVTFNSGIFTQTPNCTCTQAPGASTADNTCSVRAVSSLSLQYQTSSNGALVAQGVNIICQKQGVDYIGKTAKAVASDQNIATPGATKIKACYYSFGGAGSTLTSPTVCSASPCVELYDSCGVISAPTRGATGSYSISIANGTFAGSSFIHCKFHCASSGGFRNCNNTSTGNFMASNSSGGASMLLDATNQSGVISDSYATFSCEGQAP